MMATMGVFAQESQEIEPPKNVKARAVSEAKQTQQLAVQHFDLIK